MMLQNQMLEQIEGMSLGNMVCVGENRATESQYPLLTEIDHHRSIEKAQMCQPGTF